MLAHLDSAQWYEIDPLNALGFLNCRGKFDATAHRDLAEVVRFGGRHEELYVSNLEVGVFLQNTRPQLEKWHE